MHCLNLKVPVDQVIDLEIFVIVAPWIEQRLGHLDPTQVGDELDVGEDGDVHEWSVLRQSDCEVTRSTR